MRFIGRHPTECEWSGERLSEYLDGGLSGGERRRVAAHLAACANCREQLRSLRLTVDLLRSLPQVRVPRSFLVTAPEPRRTSLSPLSLPVLGRATAAVAVLFAALLSASVVVHGPADKVPAYAPRAEAPALARAPAPAPVLAATPAAGPTQAAPAAKGADSPPPAPASQAEQLAAAPVAPTPSPAAPKLAAAPRALALPSPATATDQASATPPATPREEPAPTQALATQQTPAAEAPPGPAEALAMAPTPAPAAEARPEAGTRAPEAIEAPTRAGPDAVAGAAESQPTQDSTQQALEAPRKPADPVPTQPAPDGLGPPELAEALSVATMTVGIAAVALVLATGVAWVRERRLRTPRSGDR